MKLLYKITVSFILLFSCSQAEIVIAFAKSNMEASKKPSLLQKIELDKIQQIAHKNQIKVSFKPLPWRRSLLMVEKGLIDGVINASYKPNRAEYAKYPMVNGKPDSSKRLNDGNSYFIYRHVDSPLRWDGKSFSRSGKVGVMANYAVIEDLKKHKNITIIEFGNNSEIIRKLNSQKIDAYAGTLVLADEMLKKFPTLAKNIVRESLPIRKKEYFLIFSKKTYKEKAKEMETIWNGFKEFNKNR